MSSNTTRTIFILLNLFIALSLANVIRDNGDIYIVDDITFYRNHHGLTTENSVSSTSDQATSGEFSKKFDFAEIIALCNRTYVIPMGYYKKFNTTAQLPNTADKTGMCFVRCLYEKSGILKNWKLNEKVIQANIWPATGDTIEVCESEGADELNGCSRAYSIAKCLTIRALVDAPSKPPT